MYKNTIKNINDDSLKYILSFLDNITIIKVLLLSRSINHRLKKNNLFTSISVYPSDNLMDMYKHYLDHSKSIQNVTLYRMVDPHIMWPFHEKNTSYIGCYFPYGEEQKYKRHNEYNDNDNDNDRKKRICIIKQHS